jgi:hypothetical protein
MLLRRKQQFKDNSLKLTNIRIILHGVVPIGQLVRRFCEVGDGGILKVVGCHKIRRILRLADASNQATPQNALLRISA